MKNPIYTDCDNCGSTDHADYVCPCRCHGRSYAKHEDCGRCGLPVEPNDGYVLYTRPDPTSSERIVVHGRCIADEVAEGRVERVSGFAFRQVAVESGK